jgi:hypothetical protein
MVQKKPSPPVKKSLKQSAQDEFKKLRLAEMDEAYRKQLRSLTDMVRLSRLNIHKSRRP